LRTGNSEKRWYVSMLLVQKSTSTKRDRPRTTSRSTPRRVRRRRGLWHGRGVSFGGLVDIYVFGALDIRFSASTGGGIRTVPRLTGR
jgi:hypothetical protein